MEHHGYGYLLTLILASLIFQLASPDSDVAQAITVALQAATLIMALRLAPARPAVVLMVGVAVGAVLVGVGIQALASGEVDDTLARLLSLMFLAFAPVTIALGTVRRVRGDGVTIHTVSGVLCIYLLIGAMFAFLYGTIDAASSDPFFAQDTHADSSDYLYFSFTTQTTTGFGDLTAATDLGRSVVIIEELIGQIYLVTVVAVIVGNLGRRRADA
jgi:hypothetical protein